MSLRVSSMRMNTNYKNQLQHTYGKYMDLFEQSDGNKLHRASDSALGYSKYLRYQNSITSNDQFQENVTTALSWMKNADTTLTNVGNNLNTFHSKVIAAANSPHNESDLKDIAKEMLSIVQTMVQDMNIQVGDRYLFSGQSDTVLPFELSDEKMDRGLTKTLDDTERIYFTNATNTGSLTQFLELKGSDGNTYFLNNNDGTIYTKDFVNEGYKTRITDGYRTVQTGDEVATIAPITVGDYFEKNGVIKGDGRTWTEKITVDGKDVDLSFATVNQYVVDYKGDDKYISMVARTGTTMPKSDTVNVTGQDVFGADIFDCSEEHKSGTAMINELLTIVEKVNNGDYHWASSDGVTVASSTVDTVLNAQTKMAARSQAYQATQSMLVTQNESITGNISDVASTDVAELATILMQYQTVYSLSMSVGSRILPGTLADYL